MKVHVHNIALFQKEIIYYNEDSCYFELDISN